MAGDVQFTTEFLDDLFNKTDRLYVPDCERPFTVPVNEGDGRKSKYASKAQNNVGRKKSPRTIGRTVATCGKCEPCRDRFKRLHKNKLIAEGLSSSDAQMPMAFVTLTFSDDGLKEACLDFESRWLENIAARERKADFMAEAKAAGIKVRKYIGGDVDIDTFKSQQYKQILKIGQSFIRDLRMNFVKQGEKALNQLAIDAKLHHGIRYFLVSEYGDTRGRVHLHAIIYGMHGCRMENTYAKPGKGYVCECDSCSVIRKSWPYGFVKNENVRDVNAVASYLAEYVLKGYQSDPNAPPYFPRPIRIYSKKPALGQRLIDTILDIFRKHGGDAHTFYERICRDGILVGGRMMPIGEFAAKRIAEELNAINGFVENKRKADFGNAEAIERRAMMLGVKSSDLLSAGAENQYSTARVKRHRRKVKGKAKGPRS